MISPITSSTTLRVLEYGALKAAIPRAAAAARSTWLVPMQNAADRQQVRGVLEHPLGHLGVGADADHRLALQGLDQVVLAERAGRAVCTMNPLRSKTSVAAGWMFSRRRTSCLRHRASLRGRPVHRSAASTMR